MKQLYRKCYCLFFFLLPCRGLKNLVNSVRRTPDDPARAMLVLLVFRFLVLFVGRIILEVALNVFRLIEVLI